MFGDFLVYKGIFKIGGTVIGVLWAPFAAILRVGFALTLGTCDHWFAQDTLKRHW